METQILPQGCVTECPACPHRLWSAQDSLKQKSDWLASRLSAHQNVLESIRGLEDPARWGYRERSCLRAEWATYHWHFGIQVRSGREKKLVPIPGCPVHSSRVREILNYLSKTLPPPDRFPLIYVVIAGKLVTLVLKSSHLPSTVFYKESILQSLGVEGIFLNLNPSAGDRIFSSRAWHLVWGKSRAHDDGGMQYGPGGFQQLTPLLYRNALAEAEMFLDLTPSDRVLDFYSGTGTSLARWKQKGAATIGVELSGEAVECAEFNVAEVNCLRGRTSERIPQLREWLKKTNYGRGKVAVFANPPRTGFESEVLRWLCDKVRPKSIAYLSCSAGTLSRDLTLLTHCGFRVKRLIPFDFFPQTRHVEVLALLERS